MFAVLPKEDSRADHKKESSPWQELRPYTSFDLGVLGNRTDVLKCSQALNTEPFFPTPSENTEAANSNPLSSCSGNLSANTASMSEGTGKAEPYVLGKPGEGERRQASSGLNPAC